MKQWRQDELDFFPFRHNRERLNSNILITAGLIKNQLMELLAPFDLTPTQFQALQILDLQNGKAISTLHLRERMLDKMSDTPKIVDRLIKKGLVNKNTSHSDRRLVDIYLTDSGKSLLNQVDIALREAKATSAALTPKEVQTLNFLLNKIRLAPPKTKLKD
jgi:DNA-binding MarR family transcriptional regulator